MADISITGTNVISVGGATIDRSHNAGETITAGQAVYLDSTAKKWKKADSNSATAEVRTAAGIALNGAVLDQPIGVQKGGDITIGATLTANTAYYLSDTPGGICPLADVGTGEYLQLIGESISTTVLRLSFLTTGVAN